MRTEEILDKVITALTGLTTTGTNVKRAQVYNSSDDELPGLAVYMGQDVLIDELQNSFLDWELTLIVESRVKSRNQVDEILNTIRGEVHVALMATPRFSLTFVHDTKPVSANEPELSGDGDQPIATQRLEYAITYRTSRTTLA